MASKTAAQEEFDNILSKNSASSTIHPSDAADYKHDRKTSDRDEEDRYVQARIDETMKMPAQTCTHRAAQSLQLPHHDFDSGRTTGVKGVIADARAYEEARTTSRSWRSKGGFRTTATPVGKTSEKDKRASVGTFLQDAGEDSGSEGERFLERWRHQRRMELENEGRNIRNRRTSPSVRRYGKFEEVDALGYLDAIEKVTRDTVVVVFVYDHECPVSQVISSALNPLPSKYPTIRFVKVTYDDIEFDNAGVPAVLGYKNCGDLFANLTYIIEQIPENTEFDTKAMETILRKHDVL